MIYDSIIVLGLNIRHTAHGYRPTTYEDHDEFGMLGGEMNVLAASLLHEQQATRTFVFSTGTSAKTIAKYGPDTPSEASVYSRAFRDQIASSGQPDPAIILEDRSVNTYSNLVECIDIINHHDWPHIAILSARYHIPRVQALWELARQHHPTGQQSVDFLIAEDIIEHQLPGQHDQQIATAYASDQGQKRLRTESQGVQDMRDGKYIVTEYQFHQPSSRSSA